MTIGRGCWRFDGLYCESLPGEVIESVVCVRLADVLKGLLIVIDSVWWDIALMLSST